MNLLFTSVGRRGYLIEYFRNALGECGGKIHVMNSSPLSPVFSIADKATVSPLIYDKNYIPFLLKYCEENCIDALIPLFDIDLPVLSEHQDVFRQIGTRVIVSEPSVISICNDKWKTYAFLSENGLRAPKTVLTLEEAIGSISRGEMSYPVIIKPRWGMGSIQVYLADNEEELRVLYKKVQREIFNTYLKYESMACKDSCVIIQEKLKGQEYGLDVINDLDGNYQTTIVKRKIAMRAGETDCAVTENVEDIKTIGERLGKGLRHIGNLDVDLFFENGSAYVLEMNARFGGGYPFSQIAGVDLPSALIRWLQGKEVNKEMLTEEIGVTAQKDIRLLRL